MKATEIIKAVMESHGLKQIHLTQKMGLASQSGLSAKLRRDIKISSLAEFAEALDGEVIWRDKTTGEEYQITE